MQTIQHPHFLDYNINDIIGASKTCSLTQLICGQADDPGKFLGEGIGVIHIVVWFYLFGQTLLLHYFYLGYGLIDLESSRHPFE